jgi:hypothetical protein
MKRRIIVAGFALLAISSGGSSLAQQIPAVGFTALLCRLGVSGSNEYCAPGNAQLCLLVADQPEGENAGGTRTADVTVFHGQSSSDHTLTYDDDGDGVLDCGDTILSVE